jgi:hypothetical protein
MRSSALAVILALSLPSVAAAQSVEVPSSGPTLEELGFSQAQVQGSDQEQALLDKRSRMLKTHQELGLLTIAPLLATLYTAPGDKSHQEARNVHAALGLTTASLFAATAYYALAAPKPKGTVDKGPIRWHKRFALVAGVGMILTPILGAAAYDQSSRGERVHGVASLHGTAAAITALSYGGAVLSVSIKF